VEKWRRLLDQKADSFKLLKAPEVEELGRKIDGYVAKREQDLLSYLISQVDPFLRVSISEEKGVIHYESSYHTPVLNPSTVIEWHLPSLGSSLSRIVVKGRVLLLFSGNKITAQYFALESIPESATQQSTSPGLQLIGVFTGLQPPPGQLMRMENAVFELKESAWTLKIPKPGRSV